MTTRVYPIDTLLDKKRPSLLTAELFNNYQFILPAIHVISLTFLGASIP